MKKTENIISLNKICKSFPLEVGGVQQVLFDITFNIKSGEFVAIMGPSGSGKSTCMNIIGALDTASSGVYELYGRNITNMTDDELAAVRNEHIGFVFQNFNLLPKRSVLDNVMLPLMYRGMSPDERVARALAGDPKLILADEPTGALDSKMGNEILKFFKQLNKEMGITIVMITHEFDIARYAGRLVHIYDGRINYDGPIPASESVLTRKTKATK